MITVSINAHPDIEDKINNYNINLNQVMLYLIFEKIEDEENYKLAVENYEEYKSNIVKIEKYELVILIIQIDKRDKIYI